MALLAIGDGPSTRTQLQPQGGGMLKLASEAAAPCGPIITEAGDRSRREVPFEFDREAAAAFIEPLFTRTGRGALRDLRGIGGGPVTRLFTAHRGRALAFCAMGVGSGRDIYIGALPRSSASSKATAVAAYDAIWADLDCGTDLPITKGHDTEADALDTVASFPLRPTLLVGSGHGVHAWWVLNRAIAPTDWSDQILRLNRYLRGDMAAIDGARILRVPGTTNFKGAAVPVRLLDVAPVCSADAMKDALDELVPAAPVALVHQRLVTETIGSRTARPAAGTPFEEANDVPIARVLERVGVTSLHRRGSRIYCGCPVCPGPDDEEMLVGGRSNVAHCFGDCRRTFTNVDLVSAVLGLSPRAAVDWLAETFSLVGFPHRGLR